MASDGATGKMWLADCQLYGATSDIYTLNAGAVVYTRNTGYANPTGVGTVGTW